MSKPLRLLFAGILGFSVYHLIRDVLTDVFGLHHPLIDFGHRPSTLEWCAPYCGYGTITLETFVIVACLIVLRRSRAGWLGTMVLLSVPLFIAASLLDGPII